MISEYLANKLLDHALGETEYTFPAAPFLALSKGCPVFQTATVATEVATGSGYARVQVAMEAADDGITYIDDRVAFPDASGGDWADEDDPITHWFLVDSTSEGGGNWLFAGRLECPITVVDGDAGPVVKDRAIMISLRGQLDS